MPKITKIQPAIPSLPVKKKVAAYARISLERGRLIHSLSAQVSHYSAFIQSRSEWEYVGVYADSGESGTGKGRSEFQRLLADCEAGKVDIVLTKTISRFARNTVDLLQTVRRLRELGVEVRFEEQNISSMSGDGELMLTILASFAQEESRSISENIKWAIRKGFTDGKQSSTQIYGYRWDGANFVIQPDEAETVRFIFSEYLAEKSPRTIARLLAEMDVKPMYGETFNMQTIMFMLQNEKYIGTVIMQKTYVEDDITRRKVINNGEMHKYVIENAHPAIIDTETFAEVQARLSRRKIAVERTAFTGKIHCLVCDVGFQRKTRRYKGVTQKVMICANKKHGKPCECGTSEIPEYILENVTAEVLGLTEFDAATFGVRVKQIVVPKNKTLEYHFTNGKTVTREWKSTAASDCWTPERRAVQSERIKNRVVTDETRRAQSEGMKAYYAANPERRKADSERMKKFCTENPEWCKAQNERMTAAYIAKRRQP